eukprot:Pgem_evm2s7746
MLDLNMDILDALIKQISTLSFTENQNCNSPLALLLISTSRIDTHIVKYLDPAALTSSKHEIQYQQTSMH